MTQSHEPSHLRLDEVIPVLEATPGVLHSLLANLPDDWLDFKEEEEAWTPRTVLVHFVHNERTNWIPRANVILSQSEVRKFPPFQQLPVPGEIKDTSAPALIAEFARLRQGSLAILRGFNLAPADYERTAEHPALGTVTLGQLLATWLVHDLNHTHQIVKSLAKRQREAVGPWRKNLAILDL
jgi:hypothetical protein